MSIEAMKQALEALEKTLRYHGVMLLSDPPQEAWKYHRVEQTVLDAITSLKQAIAEAEKQETAADDFYRMIADRNPKPFDPPQRQWVGLTNQERFELAVQTGAMSADWLIFLEAVEAKLKERNT